MMSMLGLAKAGERRAAVLAGLILSQAVCALFFIGDVFLDFGEFGLLNNPQLLLELAAAIVLIAGVVFLMIELRALMTKMSNMQAGLDIANGHLAEVIEGFFDDWQLTEAERDVGIMILKGLDNETIAALRNTAPGTVRAQATRIYAKSDSAGRAQFISLFMEELMAGEIGGAVAAPR